MDSARGRTAADFRKIEREVGRRVWNALYQGSPTPPEGGLFSETWFDEHRLVSLPDKTKIRIVAVDPSESGEGDEAGVIAAAMLSDNRIVLTHDRSGQMTSDQWADAAVTLALDTNASDIFVETYTAGKTYINVVQSHIQARAKTAMSIGRHDVARQLMFLVNRVRGWRGIGDAVARSGLLRQAIEVGTCAVLGDAMAEMETQAKLWQAGQHQPDRVAAAVIAHDRLVQMAGQAAQIGSPVRVNSTGHNSWLDRKLG
jgi:phage terminase large subunit-like protein